MGALQFDLPANKATGTLPMLMSRAMGLRIAVSIQHRRQYHGELRTGVFPSRNYSDLGLSLHWND